MDIELKAAKVFFAGTPRTQLPPSAKFIVSSHNYEFTPPLPELQSLLRECAAAGADVAKFATTATDVSDAAVVLRALSSAPCPAIALAMGERGQISRILAPKHGAFLTFGALSPERQSAPGQPTLAQLRDLYGLPRQGPATKVFGIVGNPVSHRCAGGQGRVHTQPAMATRGQRMVAS